MHDTFRWNYRQFEVDTCRTLKDNANVRDDEDKCVRLTDMPFKATKAECKVGRSIFAKGQEKIQPVCVESLSDGM